MLFIDSVNHRILDIIKDRGADQLRDYFNQYGPAAVKTITVDLLTSCRAMSRDLFPNANIVADRFHVVTQAYCEPKAVLYPTKNDAQYCSLPKAMKKARRTHYP
ncbi:transposase [Weissella cibaria]|uniref:transposase n=1 Tax=Weissella cibaria TaxID=137591 RepID=UPI00215A633C|nr:transposase [Weissella cibaria]MCR8703275.1 transposase [Weissella cibaria]